MNVLADLDACFPGYRSPERAADWNASKERIPNGSSVTGTVVARYEFGVFVDIGVGFPALLQIVCIGGLTPEFYQENKWCPVGSNLTAFVMWPEIDDGTRQIGLWQPGSQMSARFPDRVEPW